VVLLSEGGAEVEMEEAALEVEEDGELIEPLQLLLKLVQRILWEDVDALVVVQVDLNLPRPQPPSLPMPHHVDLQTLGVHRLIETEPLTHPHALTVDLLALDLHRNGLGKVLVEAVCQVGNERGMRQSKGESVFVGLSSVVSVKIDVKMVSFEFPLFFPEGVHASDLQQHVDALIVKPPRVSLHISYILLLLLETMWLINTLHYMLFLASQGRLPLERSPTAQTRQPSREK
jgi:hypothetical protein